MKVKCQNHLEFMQCIQGENTLFQDAVRFSSSSRQVDEDGAKFEISVTATSIIQVSEEGQYLLYMTEVCGIDYRDAMKEMKGTDAASVIEKFIADYCEKRGWKFLPGVIEE